MNLPAGWNFSVDVHPAGWNFPTGQSWIAGWLRPGDGDAITDLRAWLDQVPCLGLHGLPPHGGDEKLRGDSGPPYAGFSFLLTPPRHASLLRLEACDLAGNWSEFFRTPITVAPEAPIRPTPDRLAAMLPALVPVLLRRSVRQPERPLAGLADEILSSVLAEPLNAQPNPPFVGALEEPGPLGRVEHGRLSVTGWLVHRTAKITGLTAMIDPLREVPLSQDPTRPDIAENFPELAGHENHAFSGQLDLPAGLNHPVLLKILAELDTGEKHLAFAQRFTPEIPAVAVQPAPTVSGLQFGRAVWALKRAARRLGIPTSGILRQGRAAWSDYPAKSIRPPVVPAHAPGGHPPLRILVATHNLNFEGAPRLVLELSSYFICQPGISIRVISPVDGPLRQLFESAGIEVTVLDLAPALNAISAADFQVKLSDVARSVDWRAVDLVLANTMVTFWAVHLAHRAGKPSVFYVHESAPVAHFFARLAPPVLFPVIEEAFTLAERVTFTADASRQIFAPLDRRQSFRVLPSWVDVAGIQAFLTRHDQATLRTKHGIVPDSTVLLNLGTVCERKGQHVFIRAAELLEPELRAKYPERKIEFLLVGAREDSFLRSLKAAVAQAGLQNVRFVPETRENYDFHRLADILVCTSFEESSPRVLLEAAAFRTPIVSTDVFGIPEILTGREALLVEPGDHYRLAAALRTALAAHFARDTGRAERARAAVVRRFDERVSLPRHLALAREAAAFRPGGSLS